MSQQQVADSFKAMIEEAARNTARRKSAFHIDLSVAQEGSRAALAAIERRTGLEFLSELKCIISQTDRVALYHKPADWIFTLFAQTEPRLCLLGW